MSIWTLYILKCRDNSLYTGITTDLDRRLKLHNEGKASKYTRAKRPVKVVYKKECVTGSAARKCEAAIKKLSRKDKLKLIS